MTIFYLIFHLSTNVKLKKKQLTNKLFIADVHLNCLLSITKMHFPFGLTSANMKIQLKSSWGGYKKSTIITQSVN